jgi:hypothetical protein
MPEPSGEDFGIFTDPRDGGTSMSVALQITRLRRRSPLTDLPGWRLYSLLLTFQKNGAGPCRRPETLSRWAIGWYHWPT